jgi:hypothetical protein
VTISQGTVAKSHFHDGRDILESRSERLLGCCKRTQASGGMRSSAGENPRHRNATASVVLPRLADDCFDPAMHK